MNGTGPVVLLSALEPGPDVYNVLLTGLVHVDLRLRPYFGHTNRHRFWFQRTMHKSTYRYGPFLIEAVIRHLASHHILVF